MYLEFIEIICKWVHFWVHPEWFSMRKLSDRIMCHNPGTWHNCSQVKLTSEESCKRTNCKTKYKLESQNPLGNNRAYVIWENLCQCHFETIVPVSLGTIVPVSLGKNRASLAWEQSCQYQLGTIVPVLLWNSCASLTWKQLCQRH